MEVFDRPASYDPRTDPIVRVQAVRLRSKLVEYYATAGAPDEVLIELPPRGYVPVFRKRVAAASAAAPSPPPQSSIAVLPFSDMSPQQDLQFFCDGVAEQILHLLAQNPELQVVARTSSFVYRAKSEDIREIGKSLNARTILEGSVRLWGDRIRVTAQLTSAEDGYHLWSETFDRKFHDIFAIQDDIAQGIANKLGAPAIQSQSPGTAIEVYRLVLLGRHHFALQNPADFQKALECFREAAGKDPNYAPAWTGIGMVLLYQAFFGLALPVNVLGPASQAARQALEQAPQSSEAHLLAGAVHAVLEFRLAEGIAEYEQAIALDGSSGDAHDFLAMALTCQGRDAEALACNLRARELDPLSPRILENLAFTHFQFRRYSESEATYRNLLQREPYYPLGWLGLAWNALAQGNAEEALRNLDHVQSFVGDWPFLLGTRGYALARAGRVAEAQALLRQPGVLQTAGMSYERALIATGLGEKELALASLERAFEERIGWMLFLPVNPLLDPLRGELRFETLRENILRER